MIYYLSLTLHFGYNEKHSKLIILIHRTPSIKNHIQQIRCLYPLWQISYSLGTMTPKVTWLCQVNFSALNFPLLHFCGVKMSPKPKENPNWMSENFTCLWIFLLLFSSYVYTKKRYKVCTECENVHTWYKNTSESFRILDTLCRPDVIFKLIL